MTPSQGWQWPASHAGTPRAGGKICLARRFSPLWRACSRDRQIASAIAGRAVAVHCESPDSWQALSNTLGFDADAELGYVPVSYDPLGQTVAGDSNLVELAPQVWPLAAAVRVHRPEVDYLRRDDRQTADGVVKRHVLVHERIKANGRVRMRVVWRVRLVRTTVMRVTKSAPRPCFSAAAPVSGMTNA